MITLLLGKVLLALTGELSNEGYKLITNGVAYVSFLQFEMKLDHFFWQSFPLVDREKCMSLYKLDKEKKDLGLFWISNIGY